MSKRVTVYTRGRKVLTKINEGLTVEQFLNQINQKNNTYYKHIWLSETGDEGEIDGIFFNHPRLFFFFLHFCSFFIIVIVV